MRNAHFCVTAQRVAVISYQCFRTTYRSQFQGSILHVVDSEINEAAVSLFSLLMSESCGPRSSSSSSSSPPPVSSSSSSEETNYEMKEERQEQKRKDPLLYFVSCLLYFNHLSARVICLYFCGFYCNRKKIRKKKKRKRNRTYSFINLFIDLLTYIFIF